MNTHPAFGVEVEGDLLPWVEGTSRSARHWEVEFRVSTIRGCPVDGHNSDEVITAVVSAAVVVCLAATAGTASFVSRGVGAGPLSGNEAPDGEGGLFLVVDAHQEGQGIRVNEKVDFYE